MYGTTTARWLLVAGACLASAGCASQPDIVPPASEPPPTEEVTDPGDVRIDLGPAGMAATILAPEGARAQATPDGVELQGGDGFHLVVGRGPLDPLAQKEWIVREYGDGFRRFVRDEGTEVVYEVSTIKDPVFHFFLSNDDAPIPYHCRTADEGVATLDLVERMIEACRKVRHRSDIEPGPVADSPENP